MTHDDYYKYPRTYHLPFSEGATDDDKTLGWATIEGSALGQSKDVVVTQKMDGENASIYRNHYHARSLDSRHHPSRDWIKKLQARIGYQLPETFRVCGENMFAEHSIRYDDLESYFYAFSVWEDDRCLSWDESVEWFELLNLCYVPVLYRGPFDADVLRNLAEDLDPESEEGYVVRTAAGFQYDDFPQHVAKYVRADHVQTDEHWMHQEVIPNGLKEG